MSPAPQPSSPPSISKPTALSSSTSPSASVSVTSSSTAAAAAGPHVGPNGGSRAPSRGQTPARHGHSHGQQMGRSQVRAGGISKSPNRARDASFTACLTCRSKKVKCSGGSPCAYCSKRGLQCTATAPGQRRAYSVTRIQELESRLAEYERTIATGTPSGPSAPAPSTSVSTSTVIPTPAPPPPPTVHPSSQAHSHSHSHSHACAHHHPSRVSSHTHTPVQTPSTAKRHLLDDKESASRNDSPDSTIFADSALSSSHTFGSRLENIFNRRPHGNPTPNGPATPSTSAATRTPPPLRPRGFPSVPSETAAFQLLDVTMLHLSHIQHHFDARLFADKLNTFYGGRTVLEPEFYTSPWVVELLLVLAVGKLLAGAFQVEDEDGRQAEEELPGAEMFRYAHANLPNLSNMLSLGPLGVELLALTAMFLQNSGRKEEAYVYISTALRLCLTHGYHIESTKKPLLQSERVHINRLWWTVYMQERRVAAATGHSSSVDDESIEIPLPSSAPGFFHPGALCTTIKIARVTGHIMGVLYGPGLRTEEQFVPNVQEIVRQLYDISKEIPAELGAEYHGVDTDVSFRTVASLHLMLYHTIILTIRPILLHVAQLILSGRGLKPSQLQTSPLGKLSRTCTEAARRSLRVLVALQKRDMMLSFGFFDSDALFSVGFILILAAVLDSQEPGARSSTSLGLDDAIGVMEHIAARGNRVAAERLEAVKRIWLKVSEYLADVSAAGPPQALSAASAAAAAAAAAATAAAATAAAAAAATASAAPTQLMNNSTGLASTANAGNPYSDVPRQVSQPQQTGVDGLFSEAPIHTDLLNDISHLWQAPAPVDVGMGGISETENMAIDDRSYFSLYMDQDWTLVGEGETDFAELSRQILEWS